MDLTAPAPHCPPAKFFSLPRLIRSASEAAVEHPVWSSCPWSPLASLLPFALCGPCSFPSGPTRCCSGSPRLPSLSYKPSLKWLLKLNSATLNCLYTATVVAKGAAALLIMPSVRVCSASTLNRMWFFPQVLLKVPALCSFVFFCMFLP